MINYNLNELPIFRGIPDKDLASMLKCLNPNMKTYLKGQVILDYEDTPLGIGVVLSGAVNISRTDINGNQTIIAEIGKNNMFAEAFVLAGVKEVPVRVSSSVKSLILFVNYEKAITTCTNACTGHTMLIKNLLKILAEKNIYLNSKAELLSLRTTREKILSYLRTQSKNTKNIAFNIPFDRIQMSEFLCVDRSALSRELSKLKSEGILDYKKNRFTLF